MHYRKNPIFLTHNGVIVRRCWNSSCDDILAENLFSTDENPHVREITDGAFDVTNLPTFAGKPYDDKGRRAALREAIDQKIGPFVNYA